MPLLKKEIISDNTYAARSKAGNVVRRYDDNYQKRLVTTANNMLASGIRIPAPFGHNKLAVPEIQLNQGTPQSSYNNAGYWSYFVQEPNEQGKPSIFGFIDLPGSDEDTNSAYYKAKNSAKEVSLSIFDEYEDGLQRKWKDAIMHVALVNHPVVPGMKDFEDVPENSLIINMSMIETDDDNSETKNLSLIGSLKTALADKGIILPGDCSYKTILRDILVAVSQKNTNDATDFPHVPIYMSATGDDTMPMSLEAAKAVVASKAINPDTKVAFTMEDFGYKVAPPTPSFDMSALSAQLADKDNKIAELKGMVTALTTAAATKIKNDIQTRLNNLKSRGLPEATYQALQPQVEFQMSLLADGSVAPHKLELTLSTLEAALPEAPAKAPAYQGAYVPPNPYGSSDASEADMETSINDILAHIN